MDSATERNIVKTKS